MHGLSSPRHVGKDTEKIAHSWVRKIGIFQVAQKLQSWLPYHQTGFAESLHLKQTGGEEGGHGTSSYSNYDHTEADTVNQSSKLICIQLWETGLVLNLKMDPFQENLRYIVSYQVT